MYNEMLVLSLLEEATIGCFAVNLVVVVTRKRPEYVEVYATETVKSWLEKGRLTLANEKMEAVEVVGHPILSESGYHVPGLTIDSKLSLEGTLRVCMSKGN